jgi:hypothetical protein
MVKSGQGKGFQDLKKLDGCSVARINDEEWSGLRVARGEEIP